MTLLAIDPGRSVKEASIGYCVFQDVSGHGDIREMERGEIAWHGLVHLLRPYPASLLLRFKDVSISEVVVENFVNNTRSRGGQTNGPSEVIGAIEYAAALCGTPFTRQPNTILPVAKLHAGYEQKLKHLPHQDAAFLHGYYYLVSKGLLTPKGLASTL